MDALCDATKPVRSVPDGVHAGHHREQDLRSADVARRFLSADVLLACLERHPERRPTVRVARHADDPPRHLASELVTTREVRRMGTAVAERHAKSLGASNRDVGPPLAGRSQERQAEEIGRHHQEGGRGRMPCVAPRGSCRFGRGAARWCGRGVERRTHRPIVVHRTIAGRILK